ncbi:hypothetical protein [Thalassobacillus devorans]|uniref:hypothetical protein n=1 Tax=Thalassobacillus devorans TaxID=279813 RepID=UPI00111BD175|nr:hypothetical protein [Thalassobacillus devorans]
MIAFETPEVLYIKLTTILSSYKFVIKQKEAYSKSNGIIVHGEIPQGFSPRKLTERPWKASNFPDLQTLSTVMGTTTLETESSAIGSLNARTTLRFNGDKNKTMSL